MSRLSSPGPSRTILFIAYHFPPSAAVGGQRIANFARTLRSLAWQPRVLTIADADVERLDPARMAGVEGIPIQKAPVRRHALRLAERAWRMLRPPSPSISHAHGTDGGDRPVDTASVANRRAGRFRRFVLSLMALPDWERGWCLPATLQAFRILKRDRVSWFMTSCPPYSVHLVGLAVKLLTGRRWIADFRDPWVTTGWKRLYPTSRTSMRIENWLERRVIERADLVLFNVNRLKNAYRDRYSWVPSDKFVFIPNGVAATRATPVDKFPTFTITYTGSLYVGRSPEPVLAALAHLVRDGRLPSSVRLMLIGQCDYIGAEPTAAVVRRHGLEAQVEVRDPVPHTDAVELVRRSHLALLLAPDLPYQIPAKAYDYLSAGTRILAVAGDGGTKDLLLETSAGHAFDATDVDGIAEFIRAEYALRNATRRSFDAVDRYDVRHITEELVRHLDRIDANAA